MYTDVEKKFSKQNDIQFSKKPPFLHFFEKLKYLIFDSNNSFNSEILLILVVKLHIIHL